MIVTDNLFGDMLSDIAAMLTGSLGMRSSASLGEVDVKCKKRVRAGARLGARYRRQRPCQSDRNNLILRMALRCSFDMGTLADNLDQVIAAVLASGLRTADIKSKGTTAASTTQTGEGDS
ncbi:isocitrate/isopropylmalate family dehydrogenase [Bradyrhizobium brasilense]|uniref:isocitrate/isopropylmalate family dehydrogenase n=1 Tax=Bradyrhizobium brasilense TaxID=1419277 RepID=UPI003D321BEE